MMGFDNSCLLLHCRAMIGAYYVICSVVLGRLRCAVLAVDGRRQNMPAQELRELVVLFERRQMPA